jgi:hypothetical protein
MRISCSAEEDAVTRPKQVREEITVILPLEPPELNPEAARVLLRILLKAYDKQCSAETASEPTDISEAE